MDNSNILNLYQSLLPKLQAIESHVSKNDWDSVSTSIHEALDIDKRIKKHSSQVDSLIASNPSLAAQLTLVKDQILIQIDRNKTAIEAWKKLHAEKIIGSKNVLDNFSRYYKPQNSSYYVDKNE